MSSVNLEITEGKCRRCERQGYAFTFTMPERAVQAGGWYFDYWPEEKKRRVYESVRGITHPVWSETVFVCPWEDWRGRLSEGQILNQENSPGLRLKNSFFILLRRLVYYGEDYSLPRNLRDWPGPVSWILRKELEERYSLTERQIKNIEVFGI